MVFLMSILLCLAGLRVEPEVQGGQVHHRAGAHDKGERVGERELRGRGLDSPLSLSLSSPPPLLPRTVVKLSSCDEGR